MGRIVLSFCSAVLLASSDPLSLGNETPAKLGTNWLGNTRVLFHPARVSKLFGPKSALDPSHNDAHNSQNY